MAFKFIPRRGAFALAALTCVVLLAGVACAGDDDGAGGGDAAVLNAIDMLDKVGLHGIDESINKDGTIPPTARATALKMRAVVELTQWPSSLEDAADDLSHAFEELAKALEGDNPDKAKAGAAAKAAHDVQHDFSGDVWAHLYEEAGIQSGSGGGHN